MMTPFYFAGVAAKLHRPAQGKAASGLGVVIVPPHPAEALAAAKTLRLLADQLASEGHTVLRFDLPGTGDALDVEPDGGDGDHLTRAWLAAIGQAAEELGAVDGVGGIVVIGWRLGALLGAAASRSIPRLAGLVLLDPITRGRAYGRELAMTARAVAESLHLDADATMTEQGVWVCGMLTPRATIKALATLDLAGMNVAVPTLVLRRPGAPPVAAMLSCAAPESVIDDTADGFEAIGISPTHARTPPVVLQRTVDWIGSLDRAPSYAAAPVPPAARSVLAGPDFVEEAVQFGPDRRLFGVICRPAQPAARAAALVIITAGRNPQIGWARSSVDLARRLTTSGITTLRFDLGGIGDSMDRPEASDDVDGLLYHDAQDEEVAAAIDLMVGAGFPAVTLLGACSGAYRALRSGAAEDRVDGVILVNLQRFVWRDGEKVADALATHFPLAAHYAGKIWQIESWKRVFAGDAKLRPLLSTLLHRFFRRVARIRPSPLNRKARALIDILTRRGATIDLVYSEGDSGLSELAYHFGPRGRGLSVYQAVRRHFIADADHDLTPPAARAKLFAIVTEVMEGRRR